MEDTKQNKACVGDENNAPHQIDSRSDVKKRRQHRDPRRERHASHRHSGDGGRERDRGSFYFGFFYTSTVQYS